MQELGSACSLHVKETVLGEPYPTSPWPVALASRGDWSEALDAHVVAPSEGDEARRDGGQVVVAF